MLLVFLQFCADEDAVVKLYDLTVHPTGVTLSSGAYGDVIEVTYNNKIYAAKKYRRTRTNTLKRVLGQDQVLSNVRHPNIVPYYGICSCEVMGEMTSVVVMERMEMGLDAFLREHDLVEVQKLQILHDVVQGLNHLHTMTPAIVHGYINDKKVLINSMGIAKICDFGYRYLVARRLVPVFETYDFMSPESQEESSYVYNSKHDMFSYGHLSIYVINQSRPHPLLRPTYKDPEKGLRARTEVERRMQFLNEVKTQLNGGDEHPFYSIIVDCLADEADSRPSCADILQSRVFTASKYIIILHWNNSLFSPQ